LESEWSDGIAQELWRAWREVRAVFMHEVPKSRVRQEVRTLIVAMKSRNGDGAKGRNGR
jgi:uncharacterized protein YgbK (DUF1537 family)